MVTTASAVPATTSVSAAVTPATQARADILMAEHQQTILRRTDRLFAGLLAGQWVGGILLALYFSPRTWDGPVARIHPHLWAAIFVGLAIIVAPITLALLCPGRVITRHVIAVSQMLYSALIIHIGGGRIEMHFHVFGSLAFLAFYRDWRVLMTATVVVAGDHFIRGAFFPQSVFGVAVGSYWRWMEHAAWVIFEDVFLIASCMQSMTEMRGIAERQAMLEESYTTVETKVRERTAELQDAQQRLVETARSAGMAEIATSVLHNVGNVLNSVNVSVSLATSKVQDSALPNLGKAVGMMRAHQDDLAAFLTSDERGRQIPAFLEAVSEALAADQTALQEEMKSLSKNVDHIKQIVSVQQSYARHSGPKERIYIESLMEDALQVNFNSADYETITVARELSGAPEIVSDKHVILQILINLMKNAKQSLKSSTAPDKRLTVRVSEAERNGAERIRIQVIDNGVGIEPANLTRIFNHGFTTKSDGHGFGLHAAANSAKQLGGSLSAQSDGPGTGAIFTLELPLELEVAAA